MEGVGGEEKVFRKLQDALLQRIMSSKIPQERERLLNVHRRLLKQQRLKAGRIKDELGKQRGLV